MKRDSKVTQILPAPFTGIVTGFSIDNNTGEKLVHVQAEDGSARFFKEDELKEVQGAEEDPA